MDLSAINYEGLQDIVRKRLVDTLKDDRPKQKVDETKIALWLSSCFVNFVT
jgi:hypothetical protein